MEEENKQLAVANKHLSVANKLLLKQNQRLKSDLSKNLSKFLKRCEDVDKKAELIALVQKLFSRNDQLQAKVQENHEVEIKDDDECTAVDIKLYYF